MENIKKGQVYYAKLPIYRNSHQVVKPVLIIQNSKLSEICDEVLVIPINKKFNKNILSNFQIELDEFKKIMPNSVFLLSKLMTIKKKNINGFITELDRKSMKQINKNLRSIFEL